MGFGPEFVISGLASLFEGVMWTKPDMCCFLLAGQTIVFASRIERCYVGVWYCGSDIVTDIIMGSCECTIHNETNHALHINTNYYYEDKQSTINPGEKFTWKVDTNATYQEFHIGREHEENAPFRRPVLFGDDMAEWEEISIVTPQDDVEDKWVGTKLREPTISGQVLSNP